MDPTLPDQELQLLNRMRSDPSFMARYEEFLKEKEQGPPTNHVSIPRDTVIENPNEDGTSSLSQTDVSWSNSMYGKVNSIC